MSKSISCIHWATAFYLRPASQFSEPVVCFSDGIPGNGGDFLLEGIQEESSETASMHMTMYWIFLSARHVPAEALDELVLLLWGLCCHIFVIRRSSWIESGSVVCEEADCWGFIAMCFDQVLDCFSVYALATAAIQVRYCAAPEQQHMKVILFVQGGSSGYNSIAEVLCVPKIGSCHFKGVFVVPVHTANS